MEEILIKLITSPVMPIAAFFMARNFTNSNENFLKLRNLTYILILSIVNFLIYSVEYKVIITLFNFFAIVIFFKFLFKRSFFDSFIMGIVLMILMFLSESILSIFLFPFITPYIIRSAGFIMVVINLLVGLFIILFSEIKVVNKLVNNIFLKFEKYIKLETIILSLCWIIVTTIICYFIFTSMENKVGLFIGLSVEICFIIFIVNFFKDKDNYIALNEKFESLYGYLENLESYVDAERLNIHEYKNQLSVIRSMSSDKKVLDYIDSIIKDAKVDTDWSKSLGNLPSGGFKGLIYYKFIQANSKELNILIDISPKCKSYFENMELKDIKELSRLLGIYLDNAIEASELSKNKSISLEIYKTNNMNIVISNSVDKNVDIKKFNKKGYSSKGLGRGHGLYLAKKIVDKMSNIETESNLVNNYYIQKIRLK